MLVFNRDKAELEAEFRNPGIPETGLPVEELKAGLLRLAGRKKDGSRTVVKAEAFSYLLDNMRIGVSARDLFVTLGVWGRKPFDDAILPGWKQELFDGALREAAARAPDPCGQRDRRIPFRFLAQRSGLGRDPLSRLLRSSVAGGGRGKALHGTRPEIR